MRDPLAKTVLLPSFKKLSSFPHKPPSTISPNMTGRRELEGQRERERKEERERRALPPTSRTHEYFVPKDGIDREVITADICRYLGNDALVRPGDYEVGLHDSLPSAR